jgi:hypothetical protein
MSLLVGSLLRHAESGLKTGIGSTGGLLKPRMGMCSVGLHAIDTSIAAAGGPPEA